MTSTTQAMSEKDFTTLTRKLNSLPPGVFTATTLVMENLVLGRPWAFVSHDIPQFLEDNAGTIGEQGIFEIFQVNPSCLIVQVMDQHKYITLMRNLSKGLVSPGFLSEAEIDKSIQLEQESANGLLRYLTRHFGKQGNREAIIGIYNLNDSPTITINGTTYPAFGVTLAMLKAAIQASGLPITLGSVDLPSRLGLRDTRQSGSYILAPSKNALLISLQM